MAFRQQPKNSIAPDKQWVSRIIHPDRFDAEAASAELSIFACTTMPFSRFKNDLEGIDMNNPHWVERMLTHTITTKRFLRQAQHTIEYSAPPLDTLKYNRDNFGPRQGTKDVLRSDREAERVFFSSRSHGSLMHLNKHYSEFSPIRDETALANLIRAANTHPRFTIAPKDVTACVEHLLRTFGTIESIDQFLKATADRRGVQVVYGGPDIESWYRASDARRTGDIVGGEVLGQRIPLRYALAALPLGPYEQTLLPEGRLLPELPDLNRATLPGTPCP